MPNSANDLWHDGQHTYRLVNPELVSYPIEKKIVVNGKKVIERTRVEFTIVTAERVK